MGDRRIFLKSLRNAFFYKDLSGVYFRPGPSRWTVPLKGQYHKIFDFRFFHGSVFPKPLSIPLGPFQIFSKMIFALGAPVRSRGGGGGGGLSPGPTSRESKQKNRIGRLCSYVLPLDDAHNREKYCYYGDLSKMTFLCLVLFIFLSLWPTALTKWLKYDKRAGWVGGQRGRGWSAPQGTYIYLEYHSVCPLVRIGTPLSRSFEYKLNKSPISQNNYS